MPARLPVQTSKWAQRSYRLGTFAIPVLVIGVIGSRFGYFGELETFAIVGAGFLLAFAAIVFALAGFADVWNEDDRGLGKAIGGLFFGLVGFAPAFLLGASVLAYPQLTDLSSDFIEPPVVTVRSPEEAARVDQAAAGGLIVDGLLGLPLARPIEEVYGLVMPIVQSRDWTVIRTIPPVDGAPEAIVEAVARTPLLRLEDRVSLRLTRYPEGTVLDMRSMTLRGQHDFGTNLRRVGAFFEDVVTAIEAEDTQAEPEAEAEAQ